MCFSILLLASLLLCTPQKLALAQIKHYYITWAFSSGLLGWSSNPNHYTIPWFYGLFPLQICSLIPVVCCYVFSTNSTLSKERPISMKLWKVYLKNSYEHGCKLFLFLFAASFSPFHALRLWEITINLINVVMSFTHNIAKPSNTWSLRTLRALDPMGHFINSMLRLTSGQCFWFLTSDQCFWFLNANQWQVAHESSDLFSRIRQKEKMTLWVQK